MKKVLPWMFISAMSLAFFLGQVLIDFKETDAKQGQQMAEHLSFIQKNIENLEFILPSKKKWTFKGGSPVKIINFWASWCTPCLQEFPAINKLRAQFKESDLEIIGINVDEEEPKKVVATISKKYQHQFESYYERGVQLADKLKIDSLPFSFLVVNGKIIRYLGPKPSGGNDFDDPQLVEEIKKYLNQ